MTSSTLSLLLQDASIILRPRAVSEVATSVGPDGSETTTPHFHPNETVLLVLSDLARFYGGDNFGSGYGAQKRRDIATVRKLEFYAVRVVCMSTMTLRVLADEVLARSKLIILESDGGEQPGSFISPSSRVTSHLSRLIEEL